MFPIIMFFIIGQQLGLHGFYWLAFWAYTIIVIIKAVWKALDN